MSVRISSGGERAFVSVVTKSQVIAEATVREIQAEGERLVVEGLRGTPDRRGFVGRWDTGKAAQSVQIGPLSWEGETVRGAVQPEGPPTEYWPVIEGGRAAGKPISGVGRLRIETWVRRKLLPKAIENLKAERAGQANRRGGRSGARSVSVRDIRLESGERNAMLESLTFLVVRAIRLRGTPGIAPFGKAATALRGGRAREIFERMAATGTR